MNLKLKLLVFTGLIFSLSSCYDSTMGTDGSGCGSCNTSLETKLGTYLGSVHLSDTNGYWLRFYGYPYERWYRNLSGYVIKYNISKNDEQVPVYLRTRMENTYNSCCPQEEVQDYINIGNEIVSYGPKADGISFAVSRRMGVKAEYLPNDSFNLISKKEELVLTVNGKEFIVNPDTSYSSAGQKYHSKLSLNSGTMNSVYEIIDLDADSTKITPKGVYFTFDWGIVGFYLSNNELWAD